MMFFLAFAAPTARAFDSDTQPVDLADTVTLFSNAEYSTGFVPSGSPLQAQFGIEAMGGADVSMQGDADLSWPEALLLQFTGDPGSGLLLLDASLDAVTTIAVDLSDWGYYGEFEIDRRTLGFEGAQFFDPFALADRVEIVDPGLGTNLITYTYDIFVGVSLTFSADLGTEVTVGFAGEQFAANGIVVSAEDAATPLGYESVADYAVDTTYTGDWDATLDVVITPSIEACASVFGCVTVAEFEIPFSILQDSFLQDFPAIEPTFPLPLLRVGIDQADMGSVEVGQIANLQVPIGNDGSLSVYGDAHIEGSTDFSVYPTTFDALPGTQDGLVVTYAPTLEGDATAELVLASNDPGEPDLRISLTAYGFLPDETDVGSDVDDTETLKTQSCGCASSAEAPAGALFALGLCVMTFRRRAASALNAS